MLWKTRNIKRITFYAAAVLILIIGCWGSLKSDYMEMRERLLVVQSKMVVPGKSGGLYMAFEDEDGRMFDKPVSLATYTRLNPGDKTVMELRNFDIKQTWLNNLFLFFLPIVMQVAAGAMLLLGPPRKM